MDSNDATVLQEQNKELKMPILPPLLHTRSGNEYERPGTPKQNAFTSPVSTPQGSPSKSQLPPGAKDLPNVFETSLKLEPVSPTKLGRTQLQPGSPNKGKQPDDNESALLAPGSPLKRAGQENTPPTRMGKETAYSNTQAHAALSRQEQYERPAKSGVGRSELLSQEDFEKLNSAKVKRLANVTQLYFLDHYFDLLNYITHREARQKHFDVAYPKPSEPSPEYDAVRAKYLGKERANLRKRRTRLRHGDFQILTQVGQGGYGAVYLASKKDTKEVCALKIMSKKLLFKLDEIRHVLTERDILTAANSEWLVRLQYAFQDDKSIYLAMEYVPGGDFRTLLNNTGVLHNRHARFYIAEMFLCVDALHKLGYIHRDLKPENFLVDATGHMKLTDFGLAAGVLSPMKIESLRVRFAEVGETKVPFGRPTEQRTAAERREGYRALRAENINYAKSIVGSPDYMAPEVLRGEEYDFTVDYWSLGCMHFEALAGYPPFAGSSVDETWQNLRHWKKVLQKPQYEDPNYFLSARTWDLITRLIAGKEKRFRNFEEIKSHSYFNEVSLDKIREEKPPFVPELDSETDAGYFDDFNNEADMAKYKEVHDKQDALEKMADRDEKMGKGLFVGFTFRHRKNDDAKKPVRKAVASDNAFSTLL